MDHAQQDNPSFFAIIKEGFNTNRAKVPQKIVEQLGEELMKNASIFLLRSFGEKWKVSILKEGDKIYLQDIGWQKFLKENLVMHEELLVFTYNGENRFHVQIFGKNGLEKACFKKEKGQEPEQEVAAPTVAKRKRGRPRKDHVFDKKEEVVAATIVSERKKGSARQNHGIERVCSKKEKEKTAEKIVAEGKKGSARKNHAIESVCSKKGKEKAAEKIVEEGNKGSARKKHAAERLCVAKEKDEDAATIVAKRKKGRPRKYPDHHVYVIN